jgi:RNA polymerase sigma-70 factor (ECF subfamily)
MAACRYEKGSTSSLRKIGGAKMDKKAEGRTTEIQPWLDLLRAGDAAAPDQIINHSCERLRRLARKMLGGFPRLRRWEQTDDVLQNAMVRLHRSLAEVKPESVQQFIGLAATQVRRTLIDLARHHFGPQGQAAHHHTEGLGASADDTGGLVRTCPAKSCQPDTLESWTCFHQAVEGLPEPEREAFGLLWYEGMTQREASVVLGITERTVRRRWQSARCLLYEAMQGEMPE